MLSGLFVSPDSWYKTLRKPSITPPSWVFASVWTTLYALMGISAAMVLQRKIKIPIFGMNCFYVQLMLNFLWSIIFFGLHLPFVAFIDILVLFTMIILTISKNFFVFQNQQRFF
jgi:tryptophan-rich sensory protein